MHAEAEDWSSAYEAASTAMSLIPLLTPHSLANSDKQHLIIEVAGLVSNTAAAALMAGKSTYEAIRLLELGRGVIIGSSIELRADISNLQLNHPQLAEEFIRFRDQLDVPIRQVYQSSMPTLMARQIDQRYDAARALERTIRTIQNLPGLDRFLMAPSEDEMKAAAVHGPIVIITVRDYRCDALIIKKDELITLRLLQLDLEDIQAYTANLANPDSLLLEWLWDTIAKPVLDSLGYTQKPDDCWPRIWWIPTGPLSRLPIHAAGYHSRKSADTVLDRVISSHSSSVKTLIRSRQRWTEERVARESGKAVLVGMRETPGQTDLPFVPQEIDELEHLYKSMQLQVIVPSPNQKQVISALNDCDIFHFAGHGWTNPLDPSRSALLLSGENLTVADLFETNLHSRTPFLAYLSACATGQVKHGGLIDEALHLIAAYQHAGFRHVIGTLWEVNDQSCVEAATTTYEWIKNKNMSNASVSEGLHRAITKLRASWISENAAR
ncbi:hypothetical protein TruAng_003541 [Truncatella angustata]|nr:hypothetical protein TruAng_003541 [Truncatella angustata]